MPTISLAEHPMPTGTWTCSECGKPKLRKAYPCEICFAVLCEGCADGDHERPTGEHGQMCGEPRNLFEQLESD